MSNILKVSNEDTGMASGLSIVNFKHISHIILLLIFAEFKQTKAGWVWEMVVSDNKFVFSNCKKYTVQVAGKICWARCFKVAKGEIFMRALQKGKSNPVTYTSQWNDCITLIFYILTRKVGKKKSTKFFIGCGQACPRLLMIKNKHKS